VSMLVDDADGPGLRSLELMAIETIKRGPTRKVRGRHGVIFEEEDWVSSKAKREGTQPLGKKARRVPYRLQPLKQSSLSPDEVRAILRGADDLINSGGRSMLAKILKGSRDKKLLEMKLDENPAYGYYSNLTLAEVTSRIDRVIIDGYLEVTYNYRLPVLLFTEAGWEIERETYAEELLHKLRDLIPHGDYSFVQELKDRNRQMILLLLEKIEATGDQRFVPLLEAWADIEYKKVKTAINRVIATLRQ